VSEIEPVVNDLIKMTEMCVEKDKEIERLNKIIEYLVDNSDEATNLYEDYLIKEKRR